MNKLYFSQLLMSAVALVSCGGGKESASETEVDFPVEQILTHITSARRQFTGIYISSSAPAKLLTVTYFPVAPDTFRREQTITTSIDDDFNQTTQDWSVSLGRVANGIIVKEWNTDLGSFSTFSPGTQNFFPTRAYIGASGTLAEVSVPNASGTGYDSRSLKWTLNDAPSNTADLCVHYITGSTWGGSKTSDCFSVDQAGEILGFKNRYTFSFSRISGDELYE